MHHENRGQASLYHVQSPASFWWCWWTRLPIPIQLARQFRSPAGRVPVTRTTIIMIIFSTKKVAFLRRSARWWSATRWLANVRRSLVMIIVIGGDYHCDDHQHDWWSPEIIFTEVANIWMWDFVRGGDNLSAISLSASPRTRSDWWREASALRRKSFPQMIMLIKNEKHFFS